MFRVETERNQLAFGFGVAPIRRDGALEIEQRLPASLQRGLHLWSSAILLSGDVDAEPEQERIMFDPIFFVIRTAIEAPLSREALTSLVREAERRRANYQTRQMTTAGASSNQNESRRFRVLVFGVGCLLHARQQLDGYCLIPLAKGLSHRRLHELVSAVIERGGLGGLDFNEDTEIQFEKSTPTFLVSYEAVEAIDYNDALDHCRSYANLIFRILGLDRGQMPREFACMAIDSASNQRWHMFQMPGYRGNLVSDFNPASTANRIEQLLPKLQADPFAKLLVKTYADATAEEDYGFSLLRYWSVLELVADKSIARDGTPLTHPDGTSILNSKGNPETTNSKHGRVYSYLLSLGGYPEHGSYTEDGAKRWYLLGGASSHPGYTPSTRLLSLWDMVRAVYAIRNSIAHEGQFELGKARSGDQYEQLAVTLKSTGPVDPLQFIKDRAWLMLLRELK